MDPIGAYFILWVDRGPFGSAGFITPDLFPLPPGFNIYATTVLSTCNIVDEAPAEGRGGSASTWIVSWSVHTPDGISQVEPPHFGAQNAAFIDNCHSVTFALAARGGAGEAQISIFTR